MAGEALTTQFMLGTATVMLGAPSEMLDLVPAANSIGLVKSVNVTTEPAFTDLTQGVQNKLVYSVKTNNAAKVAFEVYEYTARNMSYGLGLDAGANSVVPSPSTTLGVASTSGATTLTVTLATGMLAGDWIIIEDAAIDKTYVRKILSVAANVLTLTTALPALVIPIGAVVRKSPVIAMGTNLLTQPFLSAKIVGTTAEGKPMALLFPKVRVTNGFNLGFVTDNFGNMPFELTVYDLAASDPHYVLFGNGAQSGLLMPA